MDIFETTAREFDARTERVSETDYTDTPEPEYGRVKRVLAIEPIPLEEVQAARKDAVAALRWGAETGGITMPDGSLIATDDRSKVLLNGKYRAAEKNPDQTHRWKGAAGEIVLTSADVIAIGDAVSDHVQACFDRELDLIAEIDAAPTAADVLAIDIAAGWPDGTGGNILGRVNMSALVQRQASELAAAGDDVGALLLLTKGKPL